MVGTSTLQMAIPSVFGCLLRELGWKVHEHLLQSTMWNGPHALPQIYVLPAIWLWVISSTSFRKYLEDKTANQARVILPRITAQSLGRKSDDTDQSCLSWNSLEVSKNITQILNSPIMEFNQISVLAHANNFKTEFFLCLLEGITPPKVASCFSKLCNLCSHRSWTQNR